MNEVDRGDSDLARQSTRFPVQGERPGGGEGMGSLSAV